MAITALSAHFDGRQICLDEPFAMKQAAKLIVTILPGKESNDEHESWLRLSGQGVEYAYGEDEPVYSSDLVREQQEKLLHLDINSC
ncbi:hypothetical protein KKE26_03130 [bacterium]|nr:hypothetical protein [bacterium]MBU1754044.1 hypothetical protein [bacterium]